MKRILFVCMGNICRSPLAEGVTRELLKNSRLEALFDVDSAGTHGYHSGESPDPRAQRAALRRGIDVSRQRARQVALEDFAEFDLILAMDSDNLQNLGRLCPPEQRHKLALFMEYARRPGAREVPDPYYGGDAGFDVGLDMVEDAARGLLQSLGVAPPED
jgi:protein-tyrosine phosphatase